ncbi:MULTISPECIES: FUSC family protein [unclassified Streptomyces]|uniref:FUSC family protein n=1 Tax=unclassified Streptomyces TaxID=2593676 RepID=UPI00382056B3
MNASGAGAESTSGQEHENHPAGPLPDRLSRWARASDPGLSALRRALRAAVITPSLFALSYLVIGNPTMAIFSAFAPFVLMMFVDFGGPMRERVAEQTTLVLTSTALVCLGSLAARTVWLAGVATFVIVFVILFSGILSSALADATTSLLISFVLPATLIGPVSSIPDRIAGWTLGGAATIAAVPFLWPRPPEEPLRTSTAHVCALMARQLRADADGGGASSADPPQPGPEKAVRETADAVATVRQVFFATPHRPTGLSTTARALVRLVDRVVWLGELLKQKPSNSRNAPAGAAVREVQLATAVLLEHGASALLESESGRSPRSGPAPPLRDPPPPGGTAADLARLETARAGLEAAMTDSLPVGATASSAEPLTAVVGSLLPGFRTQRMSFLAAAIAADIDLAVSARRRTWWQRLLGHRPAGTQSDLSSARQRLAEHLNRHSVWLHNSVRGAAALAIAVVLAQVSGLEHSFWVVFGTLAVLRTNAVNTGQTAGRALLGTVIGFLIGVALIVAVSSHPVLLWLLLPAAIVLIGLEPSVTSFTAGQAGFTVVLLILFTIIQPVGWRVGLVRIQDMVLGCAVSLVVGLLFWPRGAGSALGQALCKAIGDGTRYVRAAVGYGLTRCDHPVPPAPEPVEVRRQATASARRLDDAFRGYLAERGTKRLPLSDVATLVNTVAALRLTGDAVVDLWSHAGYVPHGARNMARPLILDDCDSVVAWFETSGRALAGLTAAPAHTGDGRVADVELWDALRRDLSGDAGQGAASAAVRVIWTADHLDTLRRLQTRILHPVRAAAEVTTAARQP